MSDNTFMISMFPIRREDGLLTDKRNF